MKRDPTAFADGFAAGQENARKEIRKAIGPALREIMLCENAVAGLIGESEGQRDWTAINERIDEALRTIRDATKPRAKGKART